MTGDARRGTEISAMFNASHPLASVDDALVQCSPRRRLPLDIPPHKLAMDGYAVRGTVRVRGRVATVRVVQHIAAARPFRE